MGDVVYLDRPGMRRAEELHPAMQVGPMIVEDHPRHSGPGRGPLVIVDSTKNWWAQAEGLNALLLMADRYPNDQMRYADRFVPAYDKPTRGRWRYDGREEEFRPGEPWRDAYRSAD